MFNKFIQDMFEKFNRTGLDFPQKSGLLACPAYILLKICLNLSLNFIYELVVGMKEEQKSFWVLFFPSIGVLGYEGIGLI